MANIKRQHAAASGDSCAATARRLDCSKRGFTLIELLVTLSIITMLIAILLPVVKNAKTAALITKCMTNIKGVQQAALGYTTDSNDYFPEATTTHAVTHPTYPSYPAGLPGGATPSGLSWLVAMSGYYQSPTILRSPMDKAPIANWTAAQGGDGVTTPTRYTSYVVNNLLTAGAYPLSSTWAATNPSWNAGPFNRGATISRPSSIVHFGLLTASPTSTSTDYFNLEHFHVEAWIGSGGPGVWVSNAYKNVGIQGQIGSCGGATNPVDGSSTSNWSYLDGHAATLPFSRVYAITGLGYINIQSHFDPKQALN